MQIRKRCPDCGVTWGELHEPFCTKERCPFCGGQLASCNCIIKVLNLNSEERTAVEEYVDDSEDPLRGILARWKTALESAGRVPFGKET
jgi:hypothetical protein